MKSKNLFLISFLVFNLLLSGCGFFDALKGTYIGIIEIPSYKKTFIRPTGVFGGETIVNVNEESKSFQTFQEVGKQLQIRTISFNGKIIGKRRIPFKNLDDVSATTQNSYAVSPDGNYIVYVERSSNNLCLYDISTSKESVLWENISSSSWFIKKISYLSDTDLIIMIVAEEKIGKIGRKEDEIVRFHLPNNTRKTIINPIDLSMCTLDYAFSNNKRYLAFCDGLEKHDIYGNIKILDLKTSQIIRSTMNKGDSLISNPCWSPDDKRIAYVQDNSIMILEIESNRVKVVKNPPEGVFCLYLNFLDEKTLSFCQFSEDDPSGKFFSIDIATGKESKPLKLAFNGDIYVVDNGKKIICELGY